MKKIIANILILFVCLNGFAQTLAWLPLRLVEIFGRVGFPLYSTLRDDRPQLAAELRSNVQICGVVTGITIVAVAPSRCAASATPWA